MKSVVAERLYSASPDALNSHGGMGMNFIDHWWVVDDAGDLVFYRYGGRYSPQCNLSRDFAEQLYPELHSIFIPQVFVPDHAPRLMTPAHLAVKQTTE